MRSLSLGFAILTLTLLARPAHACWDGSRAQARGIELRGSQTTWDAALVKREASRIGRLAFLLPENVTLFIVGDSMLANVAGTELSLERRHGEDELATLARFLKASPAALSRARRVETPVFVVQVGAFREKASAERAARDFNDHLDEAHGFFEAGGFPALNPSGHVVSTDLHRVVVGAFLEPGEALAVARRLGNGAFVSQL